MPVITPTAEEYLGQFQQLLPRGRIWHRGWGVVQAADLLALMPTWVRLTLRANDVIPQTFPCTTVDMLPEWEATLGLPDPCTGPLSSVQLRTAAVCAKFDARGGQSREYFIHLAASLGFQIQIQTFVPFYAGRGRAGDHCYGEAWAYAWRVIVQSAALITWFRAGQSAAGEPLADWGHNLLQCVFAEYAPANTIIIWAYQIDSSIWDGGQTIWDEGDSVWDQGVIGDVAN